MPQEVILSRDQNKTAMPQYISRDLTNIEQMVLVPWEIENEDLGRIVDVYKRQQLGIPFGSSPNRITPAVVYTLRGT